MDRNVAVNLALVAIQTAKSLALYKRHETTKDEVEALGAAVSHLVLAAHDIIKILGPSIMTSSDLLDLDIDFESVISIIGGDHE